jgi:hypothetical protein
VADKRCDNGHFIDEAWDLCPYCPQEQSESEIAVVRPRSIALEAPPPPPPTEPDAGVAAAAPAPRAVEANVVRPHRPTSASSPAVASVPPMERTVAAAQINPAKRYVVAWLVGLSGAARGESFPVRMGRNVIGRDRRSDVVINDDQASSHHADLVFRPEEKRFILMDHNSTNGTYVNEIEIEPRRDLAARDVIRIGAQRFLFTPLCQEGFHWDDEGLLK